MMEKADLAALLDVGQVQECSKRMPAIYIWHLTNFFVQHIVDTLVAFDRLFFQFLFLLGAFSFRAASWSSSTSTSSGGSWM